MRKPSGRKIITSVLVVVGLLGVGIVLFWPWSVLFILALFDEPGGYWTSSTCTRTLRSAATSADAQLEAKLFHIQCPPGLTGFEPGTKWYDFFALTFVKPGTDPSRYVTSMSASLGYGEDNSALASWIPDMVWQGPRYFHIALPSPLEVWVKESSFTAWKDSGLKIELPIVTLEIERVPDKVAADTVQ